MGKNVIKTHFVLTPFLVLKPFNTMDNGKLNEVHEQSLRSLFAGLIM